MILTGILLKNHRSVIKCSFGIWVKAEYDSRLRDDVLIDKNSIFNYRLIWDCAGKRSDLHLRLVIVSPSLEYSESKFSPCLGN